MVFALKPDDFLLLYTAGVETAAAVVVTAEDAAVVAVEGTETLVQPGALILSEEL